MTDQPKLVYWAVHGRSDFCQAMMVAGNVDYELDDQTANAWPASKDESPFGQVPYMKHGDLVLAQGGALNRYCARLAGLYPKDAVEASVCDMYLEEVMDIFGGIFKVSPIILKNSVKDTLSTITVTLGEANYFIQLEK